MAGGVAAIEWSLSSEERASTVSRVALSIASLAFFRGVTIEDDLARKASKDIEEKAYNVARIEARTTTGVRPHEETVRAYARKLSSLALDVVRQGSVAEASSSTVGERLDLTGSRDFLESKEVAENALAALLDKNAHISSVKFSTKSFSLEAAEVAAEGLANKAGSLVEADLSDIIAGRPEQQALEVLRILSGALAQCQVKDLDLSDNALGEKGIRACAAAISGKALERLSFQNVGCSIAACNALAELLSSAESLKCLRLYNNMSDDEGAIAIASILRQAPAMEEFRMASSRVGAEGGSALAEGLAQGNSLRRLDLSDNPMTGEVAIPLAEMLRQQPDLRVLNLNDTSLGDEGVICIVQAVAESCPQLEELELALNEVSVDGARAIAVALAGHRTLQYLNLRENELGDGGVLLLSKALRPESGLRRLDLTQNQIRQRGAVALAKAVAALPEFEYLGLDENEISEEGLEEMKSILRSAGKLEALGSLEDNDPNAADGEEDEEPSANDEIDDELSAAFAARANIQ